MCARFSRYEVSDLGRVRIRETGQLLKTRIGKRGDPIVTLSLGDRRVPIAIKVLVMHSWARSIPSSRTILIRHQNANKLNCEFENLYFGERSELAKEIWAQGRMEGSLRKLIERNQTPEHLEHLRKIAFARANSKRIGRTALTTLDVTRGNGVIRVDALEGKRLPCQIPRAD